MPLVYATYLESLRPLRILGLLGSAARRSYIRALDRDMFSFHLERFRCVFVLLSCEHELTFMENLILAKVAYIVSRTAHNQRDNSYSNCSQGGREGPHHCSNSRDESQCSGEAEQTGRQIRDQGFRRYSWKGGQRGLHTAITT